MNTLNDHGQDEEAVSRQEAIFESWLVLFEGSYWLNSKAMPNGAYDVVQRYIHWDAHREGREEEAVRVMEEARAEFNRITGYDIQDFLTYERDKNKK